MAAILIFEISLQPSNPMLCQKFLAADWVFLHPRTVVENPLNLDGEAIGDRGLGLIFGEQGKDEILHKRKKGAITAPFD